MSWSDSQNRIRVEYIEFRVDAPDDGRIFNIKQNEMIE